MEDYRGISADVWQSLLDTALAVRKNAHAPYSNFQVGAALLTDEGEVIVGVNVENATFGATVCAERTAVQTAITMGFKKFKALCVVTHADHPVAPCGICRQVMAEFQPDLPILMANTKGDTLYVSLGELLPHQFGQSDFVD